jgi:hypothetical protein
MKTGTHTQVPVPMTHPHCVENIRMTLVEIHKVI